MSKIKEVKRILFNRVSINRVEGDTSVEVGDYIYGLDIAAKEIDQLYSAPLDEGKLREEVGDIVLTQQDYIIVKGKTLALSSTGVSKILSLIQQVFPELAKKNRYVKLAKDQSKLENPYQPGKTTGSEPGKYHGFNRCQQDMLNAGFMRIER